MSKTDFSQIVFNKEYHTYTLNGRKLPPVTKLINQVKPPFDRERIAARSAAADGVSVAEILARWDAEAEERLAAWLGSISN